MRNVFIAVVNSHEHTVEEHNAFLREINDTLYLVNGNVNYRNRQHKMIEQIPWFNFGYNESTDRYTMKSIDADLRNMSNYEANALLYMLNAYMYVGINAFSAIIFAPHKLPVYNHMQDILRVAIRDQYKMQYDMRRGIYVITRWSRHSGIYVRKYKDNTRAPTYSTRARFSD